ncbi:MAG: protein-L-isoaspartate(D-aspartate) O-methyltransferase [Candidatus Aenigmarchaeota archaeon]|nr:protein-L-isoaspartate(D-aspartate) O-methyltransferase [Candidatus Aenigmarchaeota archaeon]
MDSGNERMIRHLRNEGYLNTPKVIEAFRSVPRELFVPEEARRNAYDDYPLPIGGGQTISAPHMVAVMTELLEPKKTDVVLEIGAGSGWQAAVLAGLVRKVYSIELEQHLADFAKSNLMRAGIRNVEVLPGDGARGLPAHAPYDKTIVTCACGKVPDALFRQLKVRGILIAPVGGPWFQELKLFRKMRTGVVEENHGGCIFVPLRNK